MKELINKKANVHTVNWNHKNATILNMDVSGILICKKGDKRVFFPWCKISHIEPHG